MYRVFLPVGTLVLIAVGATSANNRMKSYGYVALWPIDTQKVWAYRKKIL